MTAQEATSCDRCTLPDGSLRLSPAGAKKCLADEAAAARTHEALRQASEATARANSAAGALDESRLVVAREGAARRECEARVVLLDQRVEAVERQRWIFGGVGLVLGLGVALLINSLAN